jgi:hypothetical protein
MLMPILMRYPSTTSKTFLVKACVSASVLRLRCQPPNDRVVERFCSDFEDSRGLFQICVPNHRGEDETREEIKRQILEHGIVPAK